MKLCRGVVHRYKFTMHSFNIVVRDFSFLDGYGVVLYLGYGYGWVSRWVRVSILVRWVVVLHVGRLLGE